MGSSPSRFENESFVIFRPVVDGTACAAMKRGLREIRVVCDDSAGALLDYARSDIRCYADGGLDMTAKVFELKSSTEVVPATLDNLTHALAWLRGNA